MTPSRRSAALLYGAAGCVYLLDRISKVWAESALAGRPPIRVIPGVLSLNHTTNSGGAFGLGGSAPWLFATATLVVVAIVAAASFRPRPAQVAVALGLILGGGIGNLTDRALNGDGFLSGRVTDFIDLHVWPIFNLADSAIVVGAVLLAVSAARPEGRRDAGDG